MQRSKATYLLYLFVYKTFSIALKARLGLGAMTRRGASQQAAAEQRVLELAQTSGQNFVEPTDRKDHNG